MMKQELEAKFLDIQKDDMRNRLRLLGAHLIQPEILMRRVVYDKRTNPQIQGTYVRVRDEGDKVRVSLKVNATSSGKVSDQKELDYIVSSFDSAKELFDSIGLIANAYQENLRETWHYKNSEIVVDTWPGLEPYMEIESPNEVELKNIVGELKLDWNSKEIVSTDELYAQKYKVTKDEALRKIAHCTFDSPPRFD